MVRQGALGGRRHHEADWSTESRNFLFNEGVIAELFQILR